MIAPDSSFAECEAPAGCNHAPLEGNRMTALAKLSYLGQLQTLGISWDDALALRRIAMTLHRWHELECGDSNDYQSWAITRGRKNGKEFVYDDNGSPFMERHYHSENGARYEAIPDREKGAKTRLAAIMAKYPTLSFYIQGDPRGAALYILRPGDVPSGADVSSCYSRGIAIYK